MLDMGRRFRHDNLSLIHPFLYFSFLSVGLAASIAIVTGICGVRFWKKSPSPQQSPSDTIEIAKELDSSTPPLNKVTTEKTPLIENPEIMREIENNDTQINELPLPPAMQQPKDLFRSGSMMKRATSERRASFSLSIKVPRTFSVAKIRDQKEDKGNIKGKLKPEDSVWMKTIILGGKCVPDEEDPVIYEGKGKRISAYHPKNSSSIAISRQCSFLDPDEISVHKPRTQEEKNHQ